MFCNGIELNYELKTSGTITVINLVYLLISASPREIALRDMMTLCALSPISNQAVD